MFGLLIYLAMIIIVVQSFAVDKSQQSSLPQKTLNVTTREPKSNLEPPGSSEPPSSSKPPGSSEPPSGSEPLGSPKKDSLNVFKVEGESPDPWKNVPLVNSSGAIEWKNVMRNKTNISRLGTEKSHHSLKETYLFEENLIAKTILNGSTKDVARIARDIILENLWTLKKMHVPADVRLTMWNIIKENNSSKYLTHQEIKRLDSLIFALPQNDLFDLNMSNWDIVRQLGKTKGFTRRQLGVLSDSLKRAWKDDDILQSVQAIDQIKGLICGFPVQELAKITTKTFLAINSSVFLYITGCTPHQMKTLLSIATQQHAYGPISAWSKEHIKNIGLLIVNLSPEELHKIRTDAMEGIVADVLAHMTVPQLKTLLRRQIKALTGDVLALFRERAQDTQLGNVVYPLLPTRLVTITMAFLLIIFGILKKIILYLK